jgi:RNA polymerase sigma factor (sigma-70 family)
MAERKLPRPITEYEQKYLDCLEGRRPALEALLRRVGFFWEDARDAAQEAIIEAAKLIKDQAVESLRNRWQWLREVAINKARTICRNHWQGWVALDPDKLAIYPPTTDEENDHYAAVNWVFDRLPPNQRELVEYCYIQGHSYREAAEQFNVSLGSVTNRLRAALVFMRSELSSKPEFSRSARASN